MVSTSPRRRVPRGAGERALRVEDLSGDAQVEHERRTRGIDSAGSWARDGKCTAMRELRGTLQLAVDSAYYWQVR